MGRYQHENLRRLRYLKTPDASLDFNLYQQLGAGEHDSSSLSNRVVSYFWAAHRRNRDPYETIAYYPGYASIYGARNDGIEGVTRLLPLWAARVSAPCLYESEAAAMREHIRVALLQGTDPGHPGYWGGIGDRSTLICEAADVALAAWILRDELESLLSTKGVVQLCAWLRQALDRDTVDNNWHLFVVLIDKAVESLDSQHVYRSGLRYERIKSFYRGDGCFADGPTGDIDLYNAWGFHYVLFWLDQMDPGFDQLFIRQVAGEYVAWFQYLFNSDGVVLYGRSLPYRLAMPVPVMAAAYLVPEQVSPGLALACYQSCWQSFLACGSLRYGRPTQGVFGDNPIWLDPYSGPASSFWSARSLIMFYYLQGTLDWRDVLPQPLPAGQKAKSLRINAMGACLTTSGREGHSTLVFERNSLAIEGLTISRPSFRDKIRTALYAIPNRPSNNLYRMGLRSFHSDLREYAAIEIRDA